MPRVLCGAPSRHRLVVDTTTTIGVCSRSFSANPTLRSELLARYTRVSFNDSGESLHGDSLVQFLGPSERAIVSVEPLTEQVVARLPNLRVISKFGIGLDNLDLEALKRYRIKLSQRSGENRRSKENRGYQTPLRPACPGPADR